MGARFSAQQTATAAVANASPKPPVDFNAFVRFIFSFLLWLKFVWHLSFLFLFHGSNVSTLERLITVKHCAVPQPCMGLFKEERGRGRQSAVEATAAQPTVGNFKPLPAPGGVESSDAPRRRRAPGKRCGLLEGALESQEFLGDAQDQLHAISHAQFMVQALEVSVHGVGRDAKIGGDGEFSLIIEYAAHDFTLAVGKAELANQLIPGLVRKDRRTRTACAYRPLAEKGRGQRGPPVEQRLCGALSQWTRH